MTCDDVSGLVSGDNSCETPSKKAVCKHRNKGY